MRTNEPTNKNTFMPDPSAVEISDETYRQLHDLSMEMINDTIIGKAREMAPVLFVHFRKLEENGMLSDLKHAIVVIVGYGGSQDSKYEALFKVGMKFEQERMIPAAIFMGSESWMSDKPKPGVPPSEDPDRKEYITIAGRSIGGECQSITLIPITHDAAGFIIKDGEAIPLPEGVTIGMPLLDEFFHGFFSVAKERHELRLRSK